MFATIEIINLRHRLHPLVRHISPHQIPFCKLLRSSSRHRILLLPKHLIHKLALNPRLAWAVIYILPSSMEDYIKDIGSMT